MSRWVKLAVVVVLAVPPLLILVRGYSPEHGFLGLPLFGQKFLPRALPELQAMHPPSTTEFGYDGQYYAQIALSPDLSHPGLRKACDNFSYRARRIGMPAVAWVIGLGRPAWIVQVYAVLNFVFWSLLAALLLRRYGVERLRARVLLFCILWTTGALVSVERALTDLPAITLSVWATFLAERRPAAGAALMGVSALFKETNILSFPALAWIDRDHPPRRLTWILPALVLPLALWLAYLSRMTPWRGPVPVFELPFVGLWNKLAREWSNGRRYHVEMIAPVALFVQAVYFAVRPRLSCAWWRGGVAWAVMAVVVGKDVWAEDAGYTRILLPLTVAFNVMLYLHERGAAWATWVIVGNGALLEKAYSRYSLRGLVLVIALLGIDHALQRRRERQASAPTPSRSEDDSLVRSDSN